MDDYIGPTGPCCGALYFIFLCAGTVKRCIKSDSLFFRRYLWSLLPGDRAGNFRSVPFHCGVEIRRDCPGGAKRKTEVFLLCLGLHDVYLRPGGGYSVLLLCRMGSIRHGSAYCGNGKCSGLGRCVFPVPLELYSLGLLSGAGRGLRIYAPCAETEQAKVL